MSRIAHKRSKSVKKSFFLGANPQITLLNDSLASIPQSNNSGHVTGTYTQIMTRGPLVLSTALPLENCISSTCYCNQDWLHEMCAFIWPNSSNLGILWNKYYQLPGASPLDPTGGLQRPQTPSWKLCPPGDLLYLPWMRNPGDVPDSLFRGPKSRA